MLPDKAAIITIHEIVIDTFGGSKGILKPKTIESIVARPMHHITYAECDLHHICATLLHGIANSHAFVDGNKRTAVVTCIYTYVVNEVMLDSSKEINSALEALALDVVTKKLSVNEISERLRIIVDTHTLGILGKAREKIEDFFLRKD